MEQLGGPLVVTAIAVVAALILCIAILHFRFHIFRRRKGRARQKHGVAAQTRVEVLETTVIDAERKLVLIRCDQIEHLIMIGGQADVVVENDVRKVRGPGAPAPAKIPGFDLRPPTPAPAAATHATPMPSAPKPADMTRVSARPSETRPAAAASRSLATIPPPSRAAGTPDIPPPPVPSRADTAAQSRAGSQRSSSIDQQFGRRDNTPPVRRTTQTTTRPAEPLRATSASAERSSRTTGRPAGRVEPAAALPAAQIPWSDPDSIENEIVRALRFDPQTRGDTTGRREPAAQKATLESSTTLGDLADKLEEALAREVQSARQPEVNAEEFSFESETEPQEPERKKPAAQKERPEKRERERDRSEAAKPAFGPSPEAEPRREPAPAPERREEAPVISLNSRRRESSDQLEDEMARLLGELTSDNKGR